jgi:hypothetical protein
MQFTMADALRAKQGQRERMAAAPVAEKLRILERLRDRDRAIKDAVARASPLRLQNRT